MHPARRMFSYSGINIALLPLNVGTGWVLTEYGVQYLLATAIGYGVHTTIAFFFNADKTFRHSSVCKKQALVRTYQVLGLAFLVTLLVMGVLMEHFEADFLFARLCAGVCAGVWAFALDTKYTFKKKIFS
jgi:putative flippase GtrA